MYSSSRISLSFFRGYDNVVFNTRQFLTLHALAKLATEDGID